MTLCLLKNEWEGPSPLLIEKWAKLILSKAVISYSGGAALCCFGNLAAETASGISGQTQNNLEPVRQAFKIERLGYGNFFDCLSAAKMYFNTLFLIAA
jgi:hypothetical protein